MSSQPLTADAHNQDVHGLAHHFDDLHQQHEAATLGMWTFLATEVLFFGGALMTYTVYRHLYFAEFSAGSHHLYTWIGITNTAVLLTSSFMMALAVGASKAGRRTALVALLGLTIVFGLVFLGLKGYEYFKDFEDGLVPGRIFSSKTWEPGKWEPNLDLHNVQLFLGFYWVLTAIHATHMVIGIAVLAVILVKAQRGRYTAEYNDPVDVAGLYWHFVDIVWIFLLPLLYMVGR